MNKLKEKGAANAKKLGMQRRFVQEEMQQKKRLKSDIYCDTFYIIHHQL